MIPALSRVLLLLLALASSLSGQSLAEAARTLGKKMAVRLGPGEAARISTRNLTSLPAADVATARGELARLLRRNGRNVVEITLTISENIRGYLLVAEVRREGGRFVAMESFQPVPLSQPSRLTLQASLVWEQEEPILDLAMRGDQMLVLSSAGLTRYTRVEGKWQRAGFQPSHGTPVRDPRGRIAPDSDSFSLLAPANTFQGESGAPYYSLARWKNLDFAAEPDGLVHVYGPGRQPVATVEDWGSDLVAVDGCGLLATGSGDRFTSDRVTAWDLVDLKPQALSEPLELPGPITALWPAPGGALAVIQHLTSKRYAAYLLRLDCSR